MPFAAKLVIGFVLAYALSPVDLIPDFVPVIGYLDDLVLLPLGFWLAIRLTPEDVWQECRRAARARAFELPRNRRAGAIIVLIWVCALLALAACAWSLAAGNGDG